LVGAAAFAVVVGVTLPAFADAAACASASERGQRARHDGKLLDAEQAFLQCSATECPGVVAKDCTTWLAEVRAAQPSIVIDAKDESGHDVGDATLSVDGKVVKPSLDGQAVPIDPGSHTINVRRNSRNGGLATDTIVAKETEKARVLHFTLKPGPPDFAPALPLQTTPTQNPTQKASSPMVGPWIVAGFGVVAVVLGTVLIATTPRLPSNCKAESGDCTKLPNETVDQLSTDRNQAGASQSQPTYGLITIVAGGALVAGGLIWYFLASSGAEKPQASAKAPWLQLSSSRGLVW
jgi:hypothetical protein